MNKTLLIILAALACCPALHAQGGALTPPGPPGPTMKTLDKIEPRTAVSSLPLTISQPGSYYFTGNLQFTAASGNAITINSSNVTIDLMGFTLSSTAAVTGSAITCTGSQSRICVRNGRITGTTDVTVNGAPPSQTWSTSPGGFAYGVELSSARFCRVMDLDVSGCRENGVYLGGNGMVESVSAFSNGGAGIQVSGGIVSNCVASTNGNLGVSVTSSVVSNVQSSFNSAGGIYADLGGSLSTCTAISNGGTGIYLANGTMTNCVANTSGQTGISAGSSSVTNCTANTNGNFGIAASGGVIALSKATANSNAQITAGGGTVLGNNP